MIPNNIQTTSIFIVLFFLFFLLSLKALNKLFSSKGNKSLSVITFMLIVLLISNFQMEGRLNFLEEHTNTLIGDIRFRITGEYFLNIDYDKHEEELNDALEYFYDEQKDSIFKIITFSNDRPSHQSSGTAFPIQETETTFLLLTNHHVVFDNNDIVKENIQVDFGSRRVSAILLKADKENDLALIEIKKEDIVFNGSIADLYVFTPHFSFDIEESVFTAGFPGGIYEINSGVVMPQVYETQTRKYYKAFMKTNHGASGSPIFNKYNEVIGIIFAGDIDPEKAGSDVAYFVSYETIQDFLSK